MHWEGFHRKHFRELDRSCYFDSHGKAITGLLSEMERESPLWKERQRERQLALA